MLGKRGVLYLGVYIVLVANTALIVARIVLAGTVIIIITEVTVGLMCTVPLPTVPGIDGTTYVMCTTESEGGYFQ